MAFGRVVRHYICFNFCIFELLFQLEIAMSMATNTLQISGQLQVFGTMKNVMGEVHMRLWNKVPIPLQLKLRNAMTNARLKLKARCYV